MVTEITDKNRKIIFSLLFSLSFIFFLFHWPVIKPVDELSGNHYYLAQQMSKGYVLYRDMFSDKPPLNEFIGAFCFLVCGRDLLLSIILTRFVYFFFFVLCAIPLFIISKEILGKSGLTWLVIIIYLSFNFPYTKVAQGLDWHILMNLLGLLSIASVLKGRYLLSGLFSSLATLSWQPGFIFFIIVLLTVILFIKDKKIKRLTRLILGFLLPILLLFIYAHINGSALDMVKQTILYGEFNIDSFPGNILQSAVIINNRYRNSLYIIILAVWGFIISATQMMTGDYKKADLKGYFLPLAAMTFSIFYSSFDLDGADDFIVFIP